jgi:hypothetical protein
MIWLYLNKNASLLGFLPGATKSPPGLGATNVSPIFGKIVTKKIQQCFLNFEYILLTKC